MLVSSRNLVRLISRRTLGDNLVRKFVDAKGERIIFQFLNYLPSIHMSHLMGNKYKPKGQKKGTTGSLFDPMYNLIVTLLYTFVFFNIVGYLPEQLIISVRDKGRFINWVEKGKGFYFGLHIQQPCQSYCSLDLEYANFRVCILG